MKYTYLALPILLSVAAVAQSGIAPINAAQKAAAVNQQHAEAANKLMSETAQPQIASNGAPATATGAAEAKPAAKPRTLSVRGRRDPFVSVIRKDTAGPACVSGKKCLVPEQIILRGIVRGPSGAIAVVENSQRKTYFLREKDPVFNGFVSKITDEEVVFHQTQKDRIGRTSTRQVVKRVSAKPVTG